MDVVQQVHPPFATTWTLDRELSYWFVEDGALYFGASRTYGAASADTGEILWERPYRSVGALPLGMGPDGEGAKRGRVHSGMPSWVGVLPDGSGLLALWSGVMVRQWSEGPILAHRIDSGRKLWELPIGVQAGGGIAPGISGQWMRAAGFVRDALRLRSSTPVSASDQASYTLATPQGALYVGTERGWLLKLDLRSGAVIWTRHLPQMARAPVPDTNRSRYPYSVGSLASDGTRVYAAAAMGRILAVDAATGEFAWEAPTSQTLLWQKMHVRDGLLFCATGRATVRALDASTGEERWATDLGEPERYSRPRVAAAAQGAIYVTAHVHGPEGCSSPGGQLTALDPDGAKRWEWDAGDLAIGDAVHPLCDGLIVGAGKGCVRLDCASRKVSGCAG